MNINEIFYINKYNEAFKYAINNNLTIIEIEADEKGRRFKLVKILPNDIDIKTDELAHLKDWFNGYYTIHEQQYRRLHTLGDTSAYDKLIALYNEAETKRKRIQDLEAQLDTNV